jgi:myo-inositol 2-dehydrogenase/D-chiro-inositol 1-dehydrogenase/scyllo-inositol 2-dehydrogenase (NAD+)
VSRLRTVLVGAGRAGANHALHLSQHVPAASVVGVVDADEQSARRVAESVGGATVLDTLEVAIERVEFDAVVIATPTFTHCGLAVAAASAGKHVFCEKPMAITEQQCDEMAEAAARAGVVLQIGFMRRFQPEFAEARRALEAGAIGEPMVIKSLTRGPGLPPPWAWDLKVSNGMLAEVNSHDFDSVRWLMGSDITRVYAEAANLKGADRGVDVEDFYDNAVVALRFGSGAIGTIDGTCPADYGYDARVEIVGTSGLLQIGEVRGQALLMVQDREVGAVSPVHRTWPERFEQGYRAQMRAFVEAALSGGAPLVTAADGRAAVQAVRAANRSWQETRPIALDEVAV